jgi:hypothetical protein
MTTQKCNSLCEQSEIYYFDYLFGVYGETVPEYLIDHIEHCSYCQKRINNLKTALSSPGDSDKSVGNQSESVISDLLKLHFAYLDSQVTCKAARPFLPVLLVPALKIRIPTPITVHLDQCEQCKQDLKRISGLNLRLTQLYRLSRLFAAKPDDDDIDCNHAKPSILAFVLMAFQETSEEVLKHLCVCPQCRDSLYEYRETMRLEKSPETGQKSSQCTQPATSDIFDVVCPYGFTPAKVNTKSQNLLISHLQSCPQCLSKMQELHRTVYEIAARPDSDVVTIYHMDNSAASEELSESTSPYAGFPIKVETRDINDKTPATIKFPVVSKEKVSSFDIKPVLKGSLAAAAVLLIAVSLFFHASSAGAVSIEKIYAALGKINNIHISTYAPGKEEPNQENWVSQSLKTYIIKTSNGLVLSDVANKVRKSKKSGTDTLEIMSLSGDSIDDVNLKISASLGIMPFDNMSDIPADAQWSHLTDANQFSAIKGTEVYELTWSQRTYGTLSVISKWRAFVDAEINIPRRIESYQRLSSEQDFNLISIIKVEILNDNAMKSIIDESFL